MKWRKSHGFLSAMVEQSHPASAVPSKIGSLSNMTVWNISTFLIYFSRAITLLKGLSAPRNYKKSLLLQKLYFPSLPWKFHLENVTSLLLCPCSGGSVLSHQRGCSVFSPSVYPLGPKSSSAQETAPCPLNPFFWLWALVPACPTYPLLTFMLMSGRIMLHPTLAHHWLYVTPELVPCCHPVISSFHGPEQGLPPCLQLQGKEQQLLKWRVPKQTKPDGWPFGLRNFNWNN